MNIIDHERAMTDGWWAFAGCDEPKHTTGPYWLGYCLARAKYDRKPERFREGYRPRGFRLTNTIDKRIQIRVVEEQSQRRNR